ncbi:MerR family transcriptional regulator [Murimonas intestini]|uniref:DNA-binding transcriptional MerR regulator n=1 Tax=Murimonas intestini TaxID=1337051 RepID=A0AB73T1G8_9FIRM|nr:MerR family transcriptional regulator [Murimonas intestini]MCR1842439.1 MerR family transcriptional regulator [Murimonas intestini]MCR1867203.1 MerR family transcriptional regulator [Murimonas intestini]MCR1884389.1 MerR family transcriptional regulator [Murimonas intestini]
MKTVKEVSEITGVSIRTLRYYDEIGLLKPTQLTDAGYRLYDNEAIGRLQQIMFYRELEIPLVDIKDIMENPAYDRTCALAAQRSLLERKRNHLDGIIELITDVMEGANTMSFEAFKEEEIDMILDHIQENMPREEFERLVERYGDGSIEKWRETFSGNLKDEKTGAELMRLYGSKEKALESATAQPSDMSRYQRENDEICRELYMIKDSGGSEKEKQLISRLAECYKKMFRLDNARALLTEMADGYLKDEKLRAANDSVYGEGSSEYMAGAILRYYGI